MPAPKKSAAKDWVVKIDPRDLLGGAGATLMLLGLASIHWGLGLAAIGAGLFGLAYRLSR